jgi:hypothetical protein
MTRSARAWEATIKRLARHTPQDPAVFDALTVARQSEAAGDLAEQRYLGRLPYGAPGCDEDVEHRALMLWVAREGMARYPMLRWLHHSPNEAAYRGRQGTGVSRGYPDLILHWPAHVAQGRLMGWAREIKAGAGRPSVAQLAWLAHLEALDFDAGISYGYEATRDALIAYLERAA